MTENEKLNVLDMLDSYANDNEMDSSEVFSKIPSTEDVESNSEKKEWMPDPSLLEGMDELTSDGPVYDAEEIIMDTDRKLENISDDLAIKESRASMDELSRKVANIEDAKKRNGILKLHIPDGVDKMRLLMAAGDTDYKRAQEGIDKIFEELKINYPSFFEYAPEHQPEVIDTTATLDQPTPEEKVEESSNDDVLHGIDSKVIIDKRNISEVAWTQEEAEKIKKSRTIELNIVESADVEFGTIQEADTGILNQLLSQYERKTNDVVAVLPASKYRATFTGLTYPEVIDLSSSNEMNTLDGEKKKWSICYNHIKNQSIGPWREYLQYVDPVTKKIVQAEVGSELPNNVPDHTVHHVTKFEDFLRKTSFLDLEFMLWKILCATSMDKEVVSIDCHSNTNGTECGHSYDWVYSPSELLSLESISPAILEEMKQTGEAEGREEIMKIYNTSPVSSNNFVTLHTSGFKAVYGHVSAYEYLDTIYSKMKELENPEKVDPSIVSRSMVYTALTVIKAFLITDKNTGITHRITGANNLVRVMDTLNEIDWQTISEITKLMIEPYEFRFSLRDIICPKCKNKSMIPIESISRLLFIVARSLSSVQVTLKRI